MSHSTATLTAWKKHKNFRKKSLILDGNSLDIPGVVAVARYDCDPVLGANRLEQIHSSVQTLNNHLNRGDVVYGVNTGYGGSADSRTQKLLSLQRSLIQHLQSGVLTSRDIGRHNYLDGGINASGELNHLSMPTSWVRAMMLARINSIIRGHSAISLHVIESLIALITHNIIPVIPLRGSVSASGDLCPLTYIAATLAGSPNTYVRTGEGTTSRIISAAEALKDVGMAPMSFHAKECLGLVNGTAASVALGSLVLHDSLLLATVVQALTAMAVEALNGTAESFHPFIAATRPHPGQASAASTILGFLKGSSLVQSLVVDKDRKMQGLYQDRYALRTSSQWIGPALEDLDLAQRQVSIELNSTTDNPLVEVAMDRIDHGGNFQAASVTSAMEKTRLALQMFGKLLFAQASELINPLYNKGLPSNLASDEPSLSFTAKGLDVNMAAYASELAFLANPVGTHVQSTEMHNQSVNSLALLSARYTEKAVEVLTLICASHLFCMCQGLDLRVLRNRFEKLARSKISDITTASMDGFVLEEGESEAEISYLLPIIWHKAMETWDNTATLDLADRCRESAKMAGIALQEEVLRSKSTAGADSPDKKAHPSGAERSARSFLENIMKWKMEVAKALRDTYDSERRCLFENYLKVTPQYLGHAAKKVYIYVRADLKVPFHRGLRDEPSGMQEEITKNEGEVRKTIGGYVSVIYESLRDGGLYDVVMMAVEENERSVAASR